MGTVNRSPEARRDLVDIGLYIARDNPSASNRFLNNIEGKLKLLGKHVELGESRPELGPGLRTLSAGSYVIVYRPISDGIEVARVIHASRDLESLF